MRYPRRGPTGVGLWTAVALLVGCGGPSEAPPPPAEPIVGLAAAGDSPPASGLPEAAPDTVGVSPEALRAIRPAMQAYVDDGRLSGVMTMVARSPSISTHSCSLVLR